MVCFRSRCLKNAQTATSVDWYRATGLNDIEWMLTRWLVDPRFSQIQSRGNSAASFGTGCRDSWRLESFDVSFASEGESIRNESKGYAKNELKEWSIMMVHVSPDENFVDTLHLEFFILSICNFGLYETCETSKRAYLTYLKPCSWLRASRIASLGAPWGLNQSQTALESQSSLVD